MHNNTITQKMSKVIFFDMYQTLVDTDIKNNKELTKNAFEKIFVTYLLHNGIENSEARRFQSLYDQELDSFYITHDKETEHHNFVTIVSETFRKHYGLDINKQALEDMVYEFRKIGRGYAKLYPGVKEMLEALSSDYTLILASYTQGVYSERELEELGIRKYFAHCVFSSYLGFKKKSDNFYKKCLEVAQTDPSNCIMVGDSLSEDVFMAKRNGMRAVWVINPQSKDKEILGVVPDASVPIELIYTLPTIIRKMI